MGQLSFRPSGQQLHTTGLYRHEKTRDTNDLAAANIQLRSLELRTVGGRDEETREPHERRHGDYNDNGNNDDNNDDDPSRHVRPLDMA